MSGINRFARTLLALAALTVVAACGNGDGAPAQPPAPINISALLTGDQETPPVTTTATGVGTVTVDPATRRISGVVVTSGILGVQAHIHDGAAGVAGPVIIPLSGGPTVWTVPDDTVLSEDQFAKLNSGGLYFNVHSAANPGGELRGQITQQVRFAALSGANEVPPVTTNGSGIGVLALNPTTGQISGVVRTTGVAFVDPASPFRQAHIHLGAAGTNGGVIVPLAETASGSGIWAVPAGSTLDSVQIAAFDAGNLYFNVHSEANPGGEIRGQILGTTLTVRKALLAGSQETPPVLTGATGTGIAVVNSVTREVFGDVKTAGITGVAAHIHVGAVGVAGPVRVNLDQTAAGSGVWTVRPSDAILTPDLLSQFGAGNLYFNVHSAAFPAGEIRGQINLVPTDNVFNLGGGTTVVVSPPGGTPPVVFPSSGLSFSAHIQQIFNSNCIACHAAGRVASFFPLTAGVSYTGLVNVPAVSPAVPGTRVVPGNSANSVLYQRISGIGLPDQTLRMPLGGPFLNPNAENAVRAWIDEGALNN